MYLSRDDVSAPILAPHFPYQPFNRARRRAPPIRATVSKMPAGMKPLEKFLKKQTTALTRAGGFGGEKAAAGTSAARRRASLSRVVPFFRESSPEGGPARGDVFSPDSEEAPSWPSAAATDIRSPSLSSDEQSSEASLDTGWTPMPADTPENLALALLDSVAGKRFGNCTGTGQFL